MSLKTNKDVQPAKPVRYECKRKEEEKLREEHVVCLFQAIHTSATCRQYCVRASVRLTRRKELLAQNIQPILPVLKNATRAVPTVWKINATAAHAEAAYEQHDEDAKGGTRCNPKNLPSPTESRLCICAGMSQAWNEGSILSQYLFDPVIPSRMVSNPNN